MRTCRQCGFQGDKKLFRGKLSTCIPCHRRQMREHYKQNKSYYMDKAKIAQQEIKDLIQLIKETTPCTDCKQYFHPCQMDFDHLHSKQYEISHMHRVSGINKLKAEIDKCELVCANCHRLRTYKRAHSAMD